MSVPRIFILLALLAVLGSCGSRDSESNPCKPNTQVRPVKLLVGEPSFSEFESYTDLFSDKSFRWIERVSYPDRGGLSVDRFEVRRKLLGHVGKLEYVFYFRRLSGLRFHPDNASDFFEMAKNKGLPASNGAKLLVGDLKYWVVRRPGKEEFFGVADNRLSLSLVACIAAFD